MLKSSLLLVKKGCMEYAFLRQTLVLDEWVRACGQPIKCNPQGMRDGPVKTYDVVVGLLRGRHTMS